MSDWIQPGTPAPDFELVDADGTKHKLSSKRGGPVAVYFYPKDDTPGCTKQACGIRDHWDELNAAGVTVWGISGDDADSHRKFAAKYDLPLTLLIDDGNEVAAEYGAYGEKNMYGKKSFGIKRSTYLIDADGNVAKVWKRVKVEEHAQSILDAVAELA